MLASLAIQKGESIMRFEADVLKGKYFPPKSRERLKAIMLILFILAADFMMLIDAYGSFVYGYYDIAFIKAMFMLVLTIGYLIFPEHVTLQQMIHAVLVVAVSLVILSLLIIGEDSEFALFSLSVLPIAIFFFLGLKDGIRWSFFVFFILMAIVLSVYMGFINSVFNITLLSKVSLGYMAISYFLYVIEKERSEYENDLNAALRGKEILFKEVHHRTKNNMQVMMGLLETQSFRVQEPKYKKMFQAHVDRIKAMSYVHESLYVGKSVEKVDMHRYIDDLLSSLQDITPHIIIKDVDYIALDMKTAMNLGLICNEAVSNAIEHAYYSGENHIDVSFKKIGEQCLLIIKDYGKGFDKDKAYESLGMTLIQDLSSSLPNGSLEISVDEGTQIKVYCNIEEKNYDIA